jgi:hypothetical protein
LRIERRARNLLSSRPAADPRRPLRTHWLFPNLGTGKHRNQDFRLSYGRKVLPLHGGDPSIECLVHLAPAR